MGVTLKIGEPISLDLLTMSDFTIQSQSKKAIVGFVDGFKFVIRGENLAISQGNPVKGTIFGLEVTNGKEPVLSLTGLKLSVAKINDLVEDGNESGLAALFKQAFNGPDKLYGGDQDDTLMGFDGNDLLKGGRGDDSLHGGKGNDKLMGGIGADDLFGDAGADRFVYASVTDSNERLGTDTIFDFSRKSGDRIDLAGIDANSLSAGNGRFSFIGTKDFTGKAGELRYEKIDGETLISGDTNGDGRADLTLRLDTAITVTKDFFDL